MISLFVWSYFSATGAGSGLRTLERLQARRRTVVADSALVAWDAGRPRPTGYQTGCADGTAALSGAFWGLLFGSVYLAPLAGLAEDARHNELLARIGLPATLLERSRALLRPGTSALFVLSDEVQTELLRRELGEPRGEQSPDCQVQTLAAEQIVLLVAAFGAEDEGAPLD